MLFPAPGADLDASELGGDDNVEVDLDAGGDAVGPAGLGGAVPADSSSQSRWSRQSLLQSRRMPIVAWFRDLMRLVLSASGWGETAAGDVGGAGGPEPPA